MESSNQKAGSHGEELRAGPNNRFIFNKQQTDWRMEGERSALIGRLSLTECVKKNPCGRRKAAWLNDSDCSGFYLTVLMDVPVY